MFADGRLAGMQYFRRLGKAATSVDGSEYAQVSSFDGSALPSKFAVVEEWFEPTILRSF